MTDNPRLTYRSLDRWTDPETPADDRRRFPFMRPTGNGSYRREPMPLADTEELLVREAKMLDAPIVVVQVVADDRRAFRLDGFLRADARIDHPGVAVSLESRFGPLRYATDAMHRWHDNLRAIALALEALRKVDRYGVSSRGEQYTGWKALPAGSAMPMGGGAAVAAGSRPVEQLMSEDDALDVLIDIAIGAEPEQYEAIRASLRRSPAELRRTVREAKATAHPDRAGSRLAWNRLERALRALGAS